MTFGALETRLVKVTKECMNRGRPGAARPVNPIEGSRYVDAAHAPAVVATPSRTPPILTRVSPEGDVIPGPRGGIDASYRRVIEIYHRTDKPDEIVREGFRDGSWPDLGGDGVCFGTTVAATLAGHGDWVVVVEFPDAELEKYRMRDPTGPYEDMLFMRAATANRFPRRKISAPRSEM